MDYEITIDGKPGLMRSEDGYISMILAESYEIIPSLGGKKFVIDPRTGDEIKYFWRLPLSCERIVVTREFKDILGTKGRIGIR